MKPSEYLKDHWWKGWGLWERGKECIATVVTSSRAETGIDRSVWRAALTEVIGVSSLANIFSWNDSPERTLEEVLAVAEKAENLVEKGIGVGK